MNCLNGSLRRFFSFKNRNKLEMPFKKGYIKGEKTGGIQKGQKQPKTLIKLELKDRIHEFDDKLYEVAQELLNDPKKRDFAMKELMKYRLPQKREHSGEIEANVKISFVNVKQKLPE